MTCNTCGENKPKHTARAFPKAVVEINNPEQLVLMRKVVLPASMGTEEDVPASVGKYRNVLLVYEANNHIYLYSSDGIPTLLTQESADLDELWRAIHTEEATREAADTALSARIDGVTTAIETEEARRISADSALQANINTVSGNLGAEITARQNADTAIRGDLTTLTGRVTTAEGDIDAIEGKIPSQATAQNQLADKDFVNSSVATNTANFIGTFNSVAELEAYSGTVTNNDYAFVIVTDAQGNTAYDRYKYNGDTEQWIFEYELNNSSFTAEQWAAINSGITSGDVTKLSGLANIKTIGANLNLSQAGELSATDTTYTAGANVQISNQNVISATDTTYTHFTGATASTDGTQGLVPGPLAGDEDKYLKGDGTWGTVQAGPTVVQTTGTSTANVMSQNAVTSMVFADPATKYNVNIGGSYAGYNGVTIGFQANGYGSAGGIAIGDGANAASKHYAVAIGAESKASARGEFSIGNPTSTNLYNGTGYRLLTNVYDGQSAHDAATYGQVISYSAINGAGAPTTATEGKYVGQLYYDTTNEAMYFLKTIDTTTTPATYTWEALGGGSSVNVVQAIGSSTTDVMSQNAASNMVYNGSMTKVQIGSNSSAPQNWSAAIFGTTNQEGAIAIGVGATATARGGVALGRGSNASTQGVFDVGLSNASASAQITDGYNGSAYRLLSGIYDPQNAHDAATKGYVDGNIPATFTTNEWNALWA